MEEQRKGWGKGNFVPFFLVLSDIAASIFTGDTEDCDDDGADYYDDDDGSSLNSGGIPVCFFFSQIVL